MVRGFRFFGGCVNADYNGVWVDIEPNNLVESGVLSSVLSQYPAANQMNFNDTIVQPTYNTFTAIQNYIDQVGINTGGFIRMRFRAQNSAGCVLPHTQTVMLSDPGNPPPVYSFTIPYNTVLSAACCEGPNTQTVYTYATGINQLLYDNIGLFPNPPAIYANSGLTTYAPAGWYTDGVVARQWLGQLGFWGGAVNNPPSAQETSYIVCNNNQFVNLNSCQ